MSKFILYSHGSCKEDEVIHKALINTITQPLERIGYIPSSPKSLTYFNSIEAHYKKLGFADVVCLDIHTKVDDLLLRTLQSCTALHLSAGDPIFFNDVLKNHGFKTVLYNYSQTGGVLIGNSGGSMQFTKNVGLFQINNQGIEVNQIDHDQFSAIGLLDFEFLPHYNWHNEIFISRVKEYSNYFETMVYSCADGGALIIDNEQIHFYGETHLINKGELTSIASK